MSLTWMIWVKQGLHELNMDDELNKWLYELNKDSMS